MYALTLLCYTFIHVLHDFLLCYMNITLFHALALHMVLDVNPILQNYHMNSSHQGLN